MSERTKAIIRLIVQMVLLINMGLTLAGKNPLDIDETALTDCLTTIVTVASSIWVWWKNNNMTEAAAYAQKSLQALKTDFTDDGEEAEE
jgi:SPP1 family holin